MPNKSSSIVRGSTTLTDNWLLQNAAELLARSGDPGAPAEWVDIAPDGSLQRIPFCAGAVQTMCLMSLIEQVVFCDSLLVLKDWVDAWRGEAPQIDKLLNSGIVSNLDDALVDVSERSAVYRQTICRSKRLLEESRRAEIVFKRGEPDFAGQVLNGTAPYLAYSDALMHAYTPHPIRARMLERTLYRISPYFSARQRLEELVNGTRIKLHRRIGHDAIATTLTTSLPSIALLCLQESSEDSSPIDTALEMRDSAEFRSLRSALHEMQLALAGENAHGTEVYLDHVHALERAIREVERQLHLRELDEKDGIAEIDAWRGIKMKVPDFARRPLIAPRHTTAIYRLVVSGGPGAAAILEKSLCLGDPRVNADILEFTRAA